MHGTGLHARERFAPNVGENVAQVWHPVWYEMWHRRPACESSGVSRAKARERGRDAHPTLLSLLLRQPDKEIATLADRLLLPRRISAWPWHGEGNTMNQAAVTLRLLRDRNMPRPLKWTDTEDLALRMLELRPEVDPLTVRFTDLHAWVCALPEFADDPKSSNEKKLEAIQMAWWEEWKDAREE